MSTRTDNDPIYMDVVLAPIMRELEDRLQTPLSERDHVAATTALNKALWRGFEAGATTQAHAFHQLMSAWIEEHGLPEHLPRFAALHFTPGAEGDLGPESDAWAERS